MILSKSEVSTRPRETHRRLVTHAATQTPDSSENHLADARADQDAQGLAAVVEVLPLIGAASSARSLGQALRRLPPSLAAASGLVRVGWMVDTVGVIDGGGGSPGQVLGQVRSAWL
jgi:hypothetical protein